MLLRQTLLCIVDPALLYCFAFSLRLALLTCCEFRSWFRVCLHCLCVKRCSKMERASRASKLLSVDEWPFASISARLAQWYAWLSLFLGEKRRIEEVCPAQAPVAEDGASKRPTVPCQFLSLDPVTATAAAACKAELVALPEHADCWFCATGPLKKCPPAAPSGTDLAGVVEKRDVVSGVYEGDEHPWFRLLAMFSCAFVELCVHRRLQSVGMLT